MLDQQMVGKIGRITGTIAPGKLGEVMAPIRGGSEAFQAYASDAAIVEGAARPSASIDQMIVLSGAGGLSEALAQALSQGVAGLQLARKLPAGSTKSTGANGGGGEGGSG